MLLTRADCTAGHFSKAIPVKCLCSRVTAAVPYLGIEPATSTSLHSSNRDSVLPSCCRGGRNAGGGGA
uniref:Uncharacterized protein n=1 Tax=Anguilla anguilla TaxID=7936 RepID=A0A0E9V0H4_ANGAN